jgi:hypothetical protein
MNLLKKQRDAVGLSVFRIHTNIMRPKKEAIATIG